MKALFNTDYVIYDKANDSVARWESNGDIILFGDKSEAEADCIGNDVVIPCTELPSKWQAEIINQINFN